MSSLSDRSSDSGLWTPCSNDPSDDVDSSPVNNMAPQSPVKSPHKKRKRKHNDSDTDNELRKPKKIKVEQDSDAMSPERPTQDADTHSEGESELKHLVKKEHSMNRSKLQNSISFQSDLEHSEPEAKPKKKSHKKKKRDSEASIQMNGHSEDIKDPASEELELKARDSMLHEDHFSEEDTSMHSEPERNHTQSDSQWSISRLAESRGWRSVTWAPSERAPNSDQVEAWLIRVPRGVAPEELGALELGPKPKFKAQGRRYTGATQQAPLLALLGARGLVRLLAPQADVRFRRKLRAPHEPPPCPPPAPPPPPPPPLRRHPLLGADYQQRLQPSLKRRPSAPSAPSPPKKKKKKPKPGAAWDSEKDIERTLFQF